MFDTFDNDDHHNHDSPDFVDVEIPHTAGVASSREPTTSSARIVSMQHSNTAVPHVPVMVRVGSP